MPVDVKLFDDLDAVARDAGGALDRAAQRSLFDRLEWFDLLAARGPRSDDLLAVRARDGAAKAWLLLGRRGKHAGAYANWYSLRVGAICNGPGEDWPNLLIAIARKLRSELASVVLSPLEGDTRLPAAFRRAGWLVRVEPSTTRWDVDTAGTDFDTYWAARPGQLRSTFKRKAKAAPFEINIHHNFNTDAWAAYEAVYAASWKPEEGSPAMLRALAEQEGAAGTLRLGIAREDGRPVAAQLWLVENGEATIHKLAYAEDMKALSPGTILSHAMFRDAIDVDKVRRIDFGTGDDAYKRDWMDRKTVLLRMAAYNPRTIAGLAGAARAAASRLVRGARTG